MERQASADDLEAVELLRGIASKDSRALTKLHQLLGRRIYTFALRMIRDVDLANQVVTDTLYDVWRFPERFNGQSKVSTWVLAIAKHKALHALRQLPAEHVELDDIAETIASTGGSPEAAYMTSERMAALWHCLERLPDAHRECMHLVVQEGMALAEVAQIQGVPENTVKTRVFHARKKLQACLGTLLE